MRITPRTMVRTVVILLSLSPTLAAAQHEPHAPAPPDTTTRVDSMASMANDTAGMAAMMTGPLGIPMTRIGSGTSWLPDAASMHAKHLVAGGWELMVHGLAFLNYEKEGSDRGDEQFNSTNWGMLMAMHALGGGQLQARAMMSLEPWTVTARGYPLLLQSGESYHGQPLHDRQHPHDLFMELAAVYDLPVAHTLGLQLYLAPVGEPAIGPVAYPHRPSAAGDPLAPLSHHWQDATHISFGVITAGLYTRAVKLEGSIFNGREPDENRTDFDFRTLDSYAGRLTVNPSPNWSLSSSYAYLKSPEELHPDVSVHRVAASVLHDRPLGARGEWASALIYGANEESDESRASNSVLAETNLDLDGANTVFGRLEYVEKSALDLAVSAPPDETYDIGSFVLGYVREISRVTGGTIGLGIRGSITVIPETLKPSYGTRTPAGFAVFLRFRPARMSMGAMGHASMHMAM